MESIELIGRLRKRREDILNMLPSEFRSELKFIDQHLKVLADREVGPQFKAGDVTTCPKCDGKIKINDVMGRLYYEAHTKTIQTGPGIPGSAPTETRECEMSRKEVGSNT